MTSRTACAISVCFLTVTPAVAAADVVDYAARFIGRPYVWGAEGPNSFDCSGLTHFVFEKFGVDLPRRAVQQSQIGDRIGRRLQRGDLVFFSSDTGRSLVTHVGIYEGRGMMIDASKRHGRVRRDNLNEDFWAERFMFARRVTVDTGDRRAELPRRRDEEIERPSERARGRHAETIRTIGRIAEVLLRRPR
jgi:hypothetical protein